MKSMNPNDFEKKPSWAQVTGNSQKISIKDFVRLANRKLKESLVNGDLDIDGVSVRLLASNTGFGGERLWFECPRCQRRSGVLYRRLGGLVECRLCLEKCC